MLKSNFVKPIANKQKNFMLQKKELKIKLIKLKKVNAKKSGSKSYCIRN